MDTVLPKVIEAFNMPVVALPTFNTRDLQQVCLPHHIDLLNADWNLPVSGRSYGARLRRGRMAPGCWLAFYVVSAPVIE